MSRNWNWIIAICGGLITLVGICDTAFNIIFPFTPAGANAVRANSVVGVIGSLVCCSLPMLIIGVGLLFLGIKRLSSLTSQEPSKTPPNSITSEKQPDGFEQRNPTLGMLEVVNRETDSLIKVLKYGTKIDKQIAAINKLGKLKAVSAINSLYWVARGETVNYDSNDFAERLDVRLGFGDLRIAAVKALGEIGGPEVIDKLINILSTRTRSSQDDLLVSFSVKDALIKISENDKDLNVRNAAIHTLKLINNTQ